MQVNEDIELFDREGYVLVRNVLDQAEISELRKLCLSELSSNGTSLLVDSIIKYPKLLQAVQTPKLLKALKKVLGAPIVALPLSSIDHNRFGAFHTDTSGAELEGWTFHKDKEFRVVVLAFYLQDNDEYGGGLRLVPGSHNKPDIYVDLLRQKHSDRAKTNASPIRRIIRRLTRNRLFNLRNKAFEEVQGQIDIPTKSGDALFWDMRIVHRASPPRITGESIPGGKVALFFELGRNNQATRLRAEYMAATGELGRRRDAQMVIPPASDEFIFL